VLLLEDCSRIVRRCDSRWQKEHVSSEPGYPKGCEYPMPVFKLIAIPSNGSPRQATPPILNNQPTNLSGSASHLFLIFVALSAPSYQKGGPAMAPEPPPTQPYYERRVVLTSASTLLRRCRRGDLHHLVDSALTMPSQCRESRNRHPFAPVFRHFMISQPLFVPFSAQLAPPNWTQCGLTPKSDNQRQSRCQHHTNKHAKTSLSDLHPRKTFV